MPLNGFGMKVQLTHMGVMLTQILFACPDTFGHVL